MQKNNEMDNELDNNLIKFPNGITLDFPNDLYFFYETDSLADVSPRFISSVGVVMTHEKFISWKEMIRKNINMTVDKNASFYKMFSITKQSLLTEFEKVVVPIVTKFESQYTELPLMWDKKMQILKFFKVYEAYVNELKSVILRKVKRNPENAKGTIDFYLNSINQTLNSFMRLSLIWSFSGILDVKNRRKFENIAASVDGGYKLNLVTSHSIENVSFFDLVFDFERMHWITVADLEEYDMPIKLDKDNLLILTDDYLKYSNYVNFLLRNSRNCDFGCIIAGDTSTFKSTILKTISYRYANKKMWLPMTCYMTLQKLKTEISGFAGGIKKKDEDSLILIDDLHLQSNLKVDILEYLRMWTKTGGHYNINSKSFDSLSNLRALMTFDLKYGLNSQKSVSNIDISTNRFTYYCHSVYIPPIHRSKMKRIYQGIINYHLDSLYDHPLNALRVPIVQSLSAIDEYFRKNVSMIKYSQFSNPSNMHNKKRVIQTILTRILNKEPDIDSALPTCQVLHSLVTQVYTLRIADIRTKTKVNRDIQNIILSEFNYSEKVHGDGVSAKDKNTPILTLRDQQNLDKVVKEYASRNKSELKNIMSTHTLDE